MTGCGGTPSGDTYTTGTIDAGCAVTASFAAAWTWVGGSDVVDAAGVHGTQGVAAVSNIPGARNAAVVWVDIHGNVRLFGGAGYDSAGAQNALNDLWKYPTQ